MIKECDNLPPSTLITIKNDNDFDITFEPYPDLFINNNVTFNIILPTNFPMKPPIVKCMTSNIKSKHIEKNGNLNNIKLLEINEYGEGWLSDYTIEKNLIYLDYYASMVDSRPGLKKEFSEDEVHPNKVAYDVMSDLALKAINTNFND